MRYLLLLAAGGIFALSGCITTASFYCPNVVNTPQLSEKNQSRVAGSIGFGKGQYSSSAVSDWAFAYSPIDQLGLICNIHAFSSNYAEIVNGQPTANQLSNYSSMLDLGAGYYYSTGDKVRMVADVYGGIGFGGMTTDGFMYGKMNSLRFFAQPGIGMSTRIIDLSFNLRITDLAFHYRSSAIGYAMNPINSYEIPPSNGGNYLFVEPAFTMRLGYKFVKVQTQIMFAGAHANWCYDDFSMSTGLFFSLEYLYKKAYNAHRTARDQPQQATTPSL